MDGYDEDEKRNCSTCAVWFGIGIEDFKKNGYESRNNGYNDKVESFIGSQRHFHGCKAKENKRKPHFIGNDVISPFHPRAHACSKQDQYRGIGGDCTSKTSGAFEAFQKLKFSKNQSKHCCCLNIDCFCIWMPVHPCSS